MTLKKDSLDVLFSNARTFSAWQDKPIHDDTLHKIYNLAKMGPTSANCCPMRLVFVKTSDAKDRLKPYIDDTNLEKTMTAPVTAIIGHDLEFYQLLPELFPHADAKSWFEGNQKAIDDTAFRNGSLQGGYLIMAARALGLDCGPMSGFDSEGIRREFFGGSNIQVNFLCNLGYGDRDQLYPRLPRLDFDRVVEII